MMTRKPKILFCTEASFMHTGYSIYTKEVLSRLHDTGKYELAEFACYSSYDDIRRKGIPWRFYANAPLEENQEEYNHYMSNSTNQFGEWRFEDVCLDFQPDIVWDIRDWWMCSFEEKSPFRPFYHWVLMPTVDSAPNQEEWLATYMDADDIFAYSEYGKEVLEKETNGLIKVRDICSPAADPEAFTPPLDRKAFRAEMGFEDDIFIIGTVMRNQKRKLYPELINAFAKFVDRYPKLGKKTYLYLHTTYPDLGWDIPRLIRESGVASKILVTYDCKDCDYTFPSFFKDARTLCPPTNTVSAFMPTTNSGVSSEQLANIINCFDVYVQYSICEGFGMPQVEAAFCGVPVMSVDYSAMSSVVRNVGGVPIKCKLFREYETHTYRAYPDEEDFIEKLYDYLMKSESEKRAMSEKTHRLATDRYSWDQTAKKWEDYFDSVPLKPLETTWGSDPRIHNPSEEIPTNLSKKDFIEWCICNIWGEPDKMNSYLSQRMLRDLNVGFTVTPTNGCYHMDESSVFAERRRSQVPYTSKEVIEFCQGMCEVKNYWEQVRVNPSDYIPDFIGAASPQ
tara:strand:+ start:497 stop:2188 length:1692 start_codon:yes stop_codon:yes gene_type:complete